MTEQQPENTEVESEEQEERDPSTLTEEEKAILAKYGRLPKKTDLIKKRLRGGKARFDSADWELKKKQGDTPTAKG